MERKLPPVAWRKTLEKTWEVADELERVAGRIRQADKPSQLYEPVMDLLIATRALRVTRHDWLYELYDWPNHFKGHWPYL